MSFCSRSSSSSSMSTVTSNTHAMPSPNSIASLPSFAHSLSSFPNMTSVTNDMVHYGRTKNASEAKLNSVLQTTRQRKDVYQKGHAYPGVTSPLGNPSNSPSFDDESALTITRKKQKGSSTKDATRA